MAGPLKWLGQWEHADIIRSKNYGFAHSMPEILAQADAVTGGPLTRQNIWHLVSPSHDRETIAKTASEPADITVVELSSAKTIWIHDQPVQSNYFINHFRSQLQPSQFDRFTQSLASGTLQDWLKEHGDLLSIKDQRDLRNLMTTRISDAEIADGLRQLEQKLGHIILVPHVNALDGRGLPLPSRQDLIKRVKQIADAQKIPIFDPSHVMDAVGQPNAIEDNSTSLAHYTEAFSQLWAELFAEKYLEAPAPSKSPLSGLYAKTRRVERGELVADVEPTASNLRAMIYRSDLNPEYVGPIIESAHSLPSDCVAAALATRPDHPAIAELDKAKLQDIAQHLSLMDLLQKPDIHPQVLADEEIQSILWSRFIESEPDFNKRYNCLAKFAAQTDLSENLMRSEQPYLRKVAVKALDQGDLDTLRFLSNLTIKGLTVPPEVHLYCARLAYFTEDWPLAVEQNLVALRDLPQNLGGWIRLSRAADKLGLSDIKAHAQTNIRTLEAAS
ncbi:MAG: hypothetical protein AAF826_07060 [Pseudomonadota bacterium]